MQFVCTLVLFTLLAGVGIYAYRLADQTHGALCALRQNLEQQIRSSRKFIHNHPEGFAGVPISAIQTQMNNQISADNALSGLGCAILPPVSNPTRR